MTIGLEETHCSLSAEDITKEPIENGVSHQPIQEQNTPSGSRRLVKALINKRDYLRAQVRNFQQNISKFRFMRRKGALKEDDGGHISDEDVEDFVTDFGEVRDGCHPDSMAVKRLVEKRPPEGTAYHTSDMEGGGDFGQRSPTKTFERPVSEVKSWSDLMSTLSPKGKKGGVFPDDLHPEMTKLDDDAFLDDLPLGSEGDLIYSIYSLPAQPPLDSRLAILKSAPGNPAWSSFHSEVSAQTSASSANSLDLLLSQRNVDPEHMLRSLGFGYVLEQEPGMLRVPLRFMQVKSSANGISIEEFLEEYPELQRLVLKKSGVTGWRNLSKSISTMAAMKSLSGRTMAAAAAAAASSSPSPIGSSSSNIPGLASTPADSTSPDVNRHSSILIPENQQALARQGYYDVIVPKDEGKNGKSAFGGKAPMDAAARRAQYQKVKSKRWSLVDGEESIDASWSLDESRGRLSGTDFSSSMDSSDSPVNHSRTSSISEKRRQLEEDMKRHSVQSAMLEQVRQTLQAQGLAQDEDEFHLSVSPNPSKQNTIEKSSTLTENDCDNIEGKHVTIVVSDTDPTQQDVPNGKASISKTHTGTQSLLTIVSAQIERLSDSGSEHTLVESPRPSVDAGVPHPELQQSISKDSVFESQRAEKSVSCQTSLDSWHLDENDNHPQHKTKNGGGGLEDLPRMASVQSDSSGFGDTDNTVDLVVPDIERNLVLSLGSSSESAGTLASSNTTVMTHDITDRNMTVASPDIVSDIATQTSLSEHSNNFVSEYGSSLTPPTWEITHPQSALRTTSEKTQLGENDNDQTSRYISTVYIPPVSKIHSPLIVKQNSGSTLSGKGLVLGKTRVSVIVPNKSQTSIEDRNISKSQMKSRRDQEAYSYSVRAPLAQPEEYDSDDGGAHSFSAHPNYSWNSEQRKSEISVLNLSVADSHGFGSRILLADESDYSCSSVADSTASCSTGEILDYRKLVRLINQPAQYRGRKRSFVRYRPKKQIKDWPNLYRKRRIQEETRLLQHAVLKYKTELQALETSCSLQYHQAYEDFSEEEREEVEELQSIWREIRNQLQILEQQLAHRMKFVARGNDFFTFLSSLGVIQRMTEVLKEQAYQQLVSTSLEQQHKQELADKDDDDDNEEDEDEHEDSHTSSFHASQPLDHSSPHFMSGYGSPFRGGHGEARMYQDPHHSLEEMRRSLMDEMKQELNRSTQQLYLDMQEKDNEIQRLNLEIMMQSQKSPRRPRSTLSHRRRKQTDV